MVDMIITRDGRAVPFKREKITSAIYRAAVACGGRDQAEAERVTDDVLIMLEARRTRGSGRRWKRCRTSWRRPSSRGATRAPRKRTSSTATSMR